MSDALDNLYKVHGKKYEKYAELCVKGSRAESQKKPDVVQEIRIRMVSLAVDLMLIKEKINEIEGDATDTEPQLSLFLE